MIFVSWLIGLRRTDLVRPRVAMSTPRLSRVARLTRTPQHISAKSGWHTYCGVRIPADAPGFTTAIADTMPKTCARCLRAVEHHNQSPWPLIGQLLPGSYWNKSQDEIMTAIETAVRLDDLRAAEHLRIVLQRRNKVFCEKETPPERG